MLLPFYQRSNHSRNAAGNYRGGPLVSRGCSSFLGVLVEGSRPCDCGRPALGQPR